MNIKSIINEEINDFNNMKLVKTEKYYGSAGGQMGTISHNYVAGTKKIYEKGKLTIEEYIPRKDIKQSYDVKYRISGFDDETTLEFTNQIDWNKVSEYDKKTRQNLVDKINSTDLSKAIDFMKKNEEGITFFMNNLQKTGMSKPLAFLTVIKNYYRQAMPNPFTVDVMAKILTKYGYDVKSMLEIKNLMYKS